MQQNSKNEVVLEHPSGCKVMLLGTHHVAATAGNQTAAAVQQSAPSRVVLELDEVCHHCYQLNATIFGCLQELSPPCSTWPSNPPTLLSFPASLQARFQQLDFRLRHLLHADTASLMDLAAADDPSSGSWLRALLPDALLWGKHMKEWALLRNEGQSVTLTAAASAF